MADSDTNYWLTESCARAFWDQRKGLPYQQLVRHTAQLLEPGAGETWLDLGCGRGELTSVLWQRSGGRIGAIVAMDCNAVNAEALEHLRPRLQPAAAPEQIRFVTGNFSDGLPQFSEAQFDGIVSGLAISYAESRDPATGRYTDHAYNRLLAEMFRVLKPGGRLVFSVNVPHPNFWLVFWKSLKAALRISRPIRTLANAMKMQGCGRWLRREARRGRFHYFPVEEIALRLERAGFHQLQHRLSFAGQAYLVAVRKPAVAAGEAA